MPRSYGTLPSRSRKQHSGAEATEIQVNITGRHTMEQLALEVQRALAMVQDYGVIGLEKFRFRLLPMDADAKPMILRNELGQQVTTINIPDVPAAPVYRQNEPGVGISPVAPAKTNASAATSPNAVRSNS